MLESIVLAAALVISPNPNTPKPVARPLCLMNVGPSTIVYVGDVQHVLVAGNTVRLLSNGGKIDSVAVPTGKDPEAFRAEVARSLAAEWERCKKVNKSQPV
jgi:hypothetical protein